MATSYQPTVLEEYITPQRVQFTLAAGSLAEEKVDIIINIASKDLNLGKGAISKALSESAGPSVQQQCTQNKPRNGMEPGQFLETTGGKLSCQSIYHSVISNWSGGQGEQSFRQVLRKCLQRGESDNKVSLAMPAIGTGKLGFPLDRAAHFTLDEVMRFSKTQPQHLRNIRIIVLNSASDIIQAFRMAIDDVRSTLRVPDLGVSLAMHVLPVEVYTKEGVKVTVKTGSIIEEQVDVIINSTAKDLVLNKGYMSSAILTAAGSNIQGECTMKKGSKRELAYGDIVETKGGKLPCSKIYHGPIGLWKQGAGEEGFRKFVQTCLSNADEDEIQSMAIPPIGTGRLKYPRDFVARAIFEEIAKFSKDNGRTTLADIRVVLFDEAVETVVAFTSQLSIIDPSGMTSGQGPVSDKTYYRKASQTSAVKNIKSSLTTKEGLIVYLICGSSIAEDVDVIVNISGKGQCPGAGTSSKSLLESAGTDIQKEFSHLAPGGVDYGRIVVTPGGKLPCKKLFHCSLPEYKVAEGEQALQKLVRQVLDEACKSQLLSMTVPVQGLVDLRYPADCFSKLVIQEIFLYSQENPRGSVEEVRLIVSYSDHHTAQTLDWTMQSFPGSTTVLGPNSKATIQPNNIVQLPASWADMGMNLTHDAVSLLDTDKEYIQVAKRFTDAGGPDQICSIERIQNPLVYETFMVLHRKTEQLSASVKNHTRFPLERTLYHGTSDTESALINARGFNRSYCGKHGVNLGEGVYFTSNASTAADNNHAVPDSNGYKRVYQCRVLTGEYTKGTYQCLEPPLKDPKTGVRYDSVVDDEKNPHTWVVFYDYQAYPEYLITMYTSS